MTKGDIDEILALIVTTGYSVKYPLDRQEIRAHVIVALRSLDTGLAYATGRKITGELNEVSTSYHVTVE
jgi:hypothetical protein